MFKLNKPLSINKEENKIWSKLTQILVHLRSSVRDDDKAVACATHGTWATQRHLASTRAPHICRTGRTALHYKTILVLQVTTSLIRHALFDTYMGRKAYVWVRILLAVRLTLLHLCLWWQG